MKTLKRVLLILVFFILMILFNQSHASAITVKEFISNPAKYTGEQLYGATLYITSDYPETGNWYQNYVCVHQYATVSGNLKVRSVIDVTTNGDVTVYGDKGTVIVSNPADKQKFIDLARGCYGWMHKVGSDGAVAAHFHNNMGIFSKYGVASVGNRPSYATGTPSFSSTLSRDIRILVTRFDGGARTR